MKVIVKIKRKDSLANIKTAEAKEDAEQEFETGRFSAPPSRQA